MTIQTQDARERLPNDQLMFGLLMAHVPVVGLIIPWGYDTTAFALTASVALGLIVGLAYATLRGQRAFSVVVAMALMAFSAIMIQAQMGRIEMHFHIFGALAFVVLYRDWLPVVAGAAVIALHHLAMTALQLGAVSLGDMPVMIFNYGCSWGIAFLHAAFVVFEAAILVFMALRLGAEKKRTQRMQELVERVAGDGDLGMRLSGSEQDASAAAFNRLMDQFEQLVSRASGLSEQLQSVSSRLDELCEDTTSASDNLQSQTAQAASAMEEMTSSVRGVADNAAQGSEAAKSAATRVSSSRTDADQAQTVTEASHEAMEQASGVIRRLSEQVTEIHGAVSAINEISDQTNLLALNAAIEAARAGEHGRGFAVVADEVRNLSQRTQSFTQQVQTIVGQLNDGSEQALAAIDMGTTRSGEALQQMTRVSEGAQELETLVNDLSGLSNQIAVAAEQQSSAADEISSSVQAAADENATVTQKSGETRESAAEVRSLAGEIQQLMGGFSMKRD
ncbi:methyl-accepting chemotaxis protein [Salicola sp. Rm-C-2C1-2]|uniref:methyl-accepting chemotaxis protein n=1 Tax=Salicola sp. Rm-C-2C1-2 TaxID=3141321 RepID=UPI0032E50F41